MSLDEMVINGNAMMDIKKIPAQSFLLAAVYGGFFYASGCGHDLVCFA
jgi:hypothetical protein